MRPCLPLLRALPLVVGIPLAAPAQVRASEVGSVSQTIDGTKLTVTYSRPNVRGREVFGNPKMVRWDEVWTPGANWATTLDVSRDLRLGGEPVKRGTYSVWLVVRREGPWTLLLDPRPKRFHVQKPDSIAGQVRIAVRPDSAPFTEALTWSFPQVRADGGVLQMQWAATRIAFDIAVEPSLHAEMAESAAAPYVGTYDYVATPLDPGRPANRFVVRYENGVLKGEWEPFRPYFKRFAMMRLAPDWFAPGLYDEKGSIYEVMRPDLTFEFSRANDRVTGFEIRSSSDQLVGTGKRR
jgi:Protein of unknown function (DUF2911).